MKSLPTIKQSLKTTPLVVFATAMMFAWMLLGSVGHSAELSAQAEQVPSILDESCVPLVSPKDRFWLINTRKITSKACCVDLQSPAFSISRLSACGQHSETTLEDYVAAISTSPQVIIYVHGNRMTPRDAITRGLKVHAKISNCGLTSGNDWVIWSWPSAQEGILAADARLKAQRCDAQGLYLGWLLRHHAKHDAPTSLIGYSFGGRVITGALHAVAGGQLGGRPLGGEPIVAMQAKVGLVAPALESHWLSCHGYHRLATQNIDQLSLMYNRRDAVLKRYWLLNQVRSESALGYTGPTSFARRVDGTRLPVFSRDCAPVVGLQHVELDYYNAPCHAGRVMAKLLNDSNIAH